MLLLLIVITLAFFPKQEKRYWFFAVSALTAQLVAHVLFYVDLYGGGGDGYITSFVRHTQKNDFLPPLPETTMKIRFTNH